MKLPIYLAGGYVAKDFAREVARKITVAEPTFAWWDSDQTDAVSVAMRERDALEQAHRMFILDRDAGTGTSWEFGYWCGSKRAYDIKFTPHRFVPIDGDWKGKLDWFGTPFAITVAVRWDAQDIAGMIDDLSSYAMHTTREQSPWSQAMSIPTAPVFDPDLVIAVLTRATNYGDVFWTTTSFVLASGTVRAGFRATFGPWEIAIDEAALILLVRPIDNAQRAPNKVAQGPMVEVLLDAVRTARGRSTLELFARHCRTAR